MNILLIIIICLTMWVKWNVKIGIVEAIQIFIGEFLFPKIKSDLFVVVVFVGCNHHEYLMKS